MLLTRQYEKTPTLYDSRILRFYAKTNICCHKMAHRLRRYDFNNVILDCFWGGVLFFFVLLLFMGGGMLRKAGGYMTTGGPVN